MMLWINCMVLKSNHLLARTTMHETMAAEKQDVSSRSVGKQQ
jgi:hypothetical protein